MNNVLLGGFMALAFGLASTFYFLKASSIYFNYKEGIKRVSRGKIEIPNWRFAFPLKENIEIESKDLINLRLEHQKYITRYWSLVIIMFGAIGFALFTEDYHS